MSIPSKVAKLFNLNPNAKWIAIIFLIGLVGRFAVNILVAEPQLQFEYSIIAQNLIDGHGISWNDWGRMPLQPTALVPPLYIYFCALFLWLFGSSAMPLYFAQAVIAASGCIPAYIGGRKLVSERAGVLFAALYCVYPEMAFMHSRPVPEPIVIVLALWVVVGYAKLLELNPLDRSYPRIAATIGLLAGIGMQFRDNIALVAGAVMLGILYRQRPFKAVALRGVFWIAFVILLTSIPWTVRNSIVFERFVPVRGGYGFNLWAGNHDKATGTDRTFDGRYQTGLLWEEHKDYYLQAMPKDEMGREKFYRAEAVQYIRTHPGDYLNLCLKRFWYYIWFDPTHPLARNLFYRATYILLLLVAIPGIFLLVRSKKMYSMYVFTFAAFFALYVPVIVLPRYRLLPVLFLLLFAANTIDWILSKRQGLRE